MGFWKWLSKKVAENTEKEVKSTLSQEIRGSGLEDIYLFDFLNWGAGRIVENYNNPGIPTIDGEMFMGDMTEAVSGAEESKQKTPLKIKIKPIDVLNELETIPTPFTLSNLQDKITVLKDKEALINQHYAKREITALIERMENRKKYEDFKSYFNSFPNTNDEKIDKLLAKYDLVKKTSDIFVPEFPDVAIKTMKEYTEKMMELCGKKPIFYVIAEPDKFKKAYEKRDPILLVQSPFGFYWQILGAWDKEMLLLGSL